MTKCVVIENYDNEKELQKCTVIFPAMTPIIISNSTSLGVTFFEELGELPDFIWPLLLGGTAVLGAGGWLLYTNSKNKKMANESRIQDTQPVSLMAGNVAGDFDVSEQIPLAP